MDNSDFCPGALIRVNDYKFEESGQPPKDKYLLGLCSNHDSLYMIYTLPTSQNQAFSFNTDFGRCRMHTDPKIPYWFFPANTEVGENGFKFDKDTFVSFNANVMCHTFDELRSMGKDGSQFGIQKLDQLSKTDTAQLLKCVLKSRFLPRAGFFSEIQNTYDELLSITAHSKAAIS